MNVMKKTCWTSTHKQEQEESVIPFAQAPNRSMMRPLPAYHTFFRINRDSIIQTRAGPNANNDESEKRLLRKSSSLYRLESAWHMAQSIIARCGDYLLSSIEMTTTGSVSPGVDIASSDI